MATCPGLDPGKTSRHSYENRWHPLDLPVLSFPEARNPEGRQVMARTALKRFHQPTTRCRLPTGEPRRIVDRSSMARKEECSAGACPPLGPGSGVAESAGANAPYQTTTPAFPTFGYPQQPAFAIRTKACPRTPIRDVPSNQPRCRLPTGEPRRIVDPWSMARKEECSAGACPPLGPGSGVAESAGPTRRTRPQLRLFIPWCARSQPA